MTQRSVVPVAGPWITQKEIDYVADAVSRGWYASAGEYPERFERAFAAYVGRRYAVSLPSCTSAIHLALRAWGVGPGDEVIVPDITWIATAAPISYVGATAVFADVDEKTWCLSPDSFRALMTPRTKAVIPVDLYGHVFDAEPILSLARSRGIRVIEDAAQAIGAAYHGRKAGSLGDASVFSFHGSKTLTTGEGGMLVTDDAALYERVMILRDHGRLPGDKMFRSRQVAFKYKMSALQAALGLAQLERVEELAAKKRQIFAWYQETLGDWEGVRLNAQTPGIENGFWMVTAMWDPAWMLSKEEVIKRFAQKRIDSRPFFDPLSSLPAYEGQAQAQKARSRNKVSYRISPCGINLPSALNLNAETVHLVASHLKDILPSPCPR